MLAFFLYISAVGVINGLAHGNPMYDILKGVRLLVYLYGGYLAGSKLVKRPGQVKAFIWIVLLSNVAISLWQYYFLFAAPSLGQMGNPVGLGRWVRQYFIELPNTGLFLAIGLLIYRTTFFGRVKLWVLVITWGLSVILSFTRNQWVGTGVTLAILPLLLKDKRKVVIGLIAGVMGVLLTMTLLSYWAVDTGNIYMGNLTDTIRMSLKSDDLNWIYRITATQRGWQMVLTNLLSALGGLGFGAQISEAIIPEMEFLDWTDGYLWFLISSGLPGVAFLIILGFSFARASFQISRNSVNSLYRAFALGQCLYIIFEMVRTFVAGGFAYWVRAAYIGFIFGLIASMSMGKLSKVDLK
jgi:hypothetical protein